LDSTDSKKGRGAIWNERTNNNWKKRMKPKSIFTATLLAALSSGIIAQAQIPAPPPAPTVQLRSSAELDQMLGPIALYPDPLIAIILPAATLPSEIVLADRYVNGGGDPNLIDHQPWDPSVKALARYPTVLKWMDDSLAWTTALGQAFVYQPQDVMDSIQRLRAQAQALGNLPSTPQENVFTDDGIIEILPADPEVIYLPVYECDMVYFQSPYGVPFISFGVGWPVGLWLNYDFDWRKHHLIVWGNGQPRPANWWSLHSSQRPSIALNQAAVWQPRNLPGSTARNMDRGWNSSQIRSTVTSIGTGRAPTTYSSTPAGPGRSTVTVIGTGGRPTTYSGTPAESGRSTVTAIGGQSRPAEAPLSRPASAALIGIQSSHETHEFSSRGQESRETTISRPAESYARPAAPMHSEAPSAPPAAPGRR
jgi:hypothetical protein